MNKNAYTSAYQNMGVKNGDLKNLLLSVAHLKCRFPLYDIKIIDSVNLVEFLPWCV